MRIFRKTFNDHDYPYAPDDPDSIYTDAPDDPDPIYTDTDDTYSKPRRRRPTFWAVFIVLSILVGLMYHIFQDKNPGDDIDVTGPAETTAIAETPGITEVPDTTEVPATTEFHSTEPPSEDADHNGLYEYMSTVDMINLLGMPADETLAYLDHMKKLVNDAIDYESLDFYEVDLLGFNLASIMGTAIEPTHEERIAMANMAADIFNTIVPQMYDQGYKMEDMLVWTQVPSFGVLESFYNGNFSDSPMYSDVFNIVNHTASNVECSKGLYDAYEVALIWNWMYEWAAQYASPSNPNISTEQMESLEELLSKHNQTLLNSLDVVFPED